MAGDFDFLDDPAGAKARPARTERDYPPPRRPRPVVEPDDDYDPPPRPRRRPDDADDPQVRGNRPPGKKRGPALLIVALAGAGLLLLVGTGVIIYVARSSGKPPEPTAKDPPPVVQQPPAKKEAVDPNALGKNVEEKVRKATVRILALGVDGKGMSGSGFVERDSRLVITNAHVLGMKKRGDPEPDAINLIVNSGEGDKEYPLRGEIVSVDVDVDLAIIKPGLLVVGDRHVVPDGISVARTTTVARTNKLFVFGFPYVDKLGTEITVSETTVSSLRKDPTSGKLSLIQVQGGMNPGNSGGPVVDAKGIVVGVAVSKLDGTDINFAIPAEAVHEMLKKKKP